MMGVVLNQEEWDKLKTGEFEVVFLKLKEKLKETIIIEEQKAPVLMQLSGRVEAYNVNIITNGGQTVAVESNVILIKGRVILCKGSIIQYKTSQNKAHSISLTDEPGFYSTTLNKEEV